MNPVLLRSEMASTPSNHPASPPPNAVAARVVLPESDAFPGWVQRVTARRVEVGLEPGRVPTFSGPQLVTLVFRARSGGELAAVARWVARDDDASGAPRLVCLLVDPHGDAEEALPSGAGGEGRRGAYRVKPSSREDVPVTIRPFGVARDSWAAQLTALRTRGARDVVRGMLSDISLGGARVHVGKDDRWPYTFQQLVLLSIEFPSRLEPLHAPTSILRRIDSKEGVFYGAAFRPLPACPFEPVEREILDYVMGRQRQDLRHRAG